MAAVHAWSPSPPPHGARSVEQLSRPGSGVSQSPGVRSHGGVGAAERLPARPDVPARSLCHLVGARRAPPGRKVKSPLNASARGPTTSQELAPRGAPRRTFVSSASPLLHLPAGAGPRRPLPHGTFALPGRPPRPNAEGGASEAVRSFGSASAGAGTVQLEFQKPGFVMGPGAPCRSNPARRRKGVHTHPAREPGALILGLRGETERASPWLRKGWRESTPGSQQAPGAGSGSRCATHVEPTSQMWKSGCGWGRRYESVP